MVKLYSVKELQAVEKEANAAGLTYEMMMENAGVGIAKEIETAYSQVPNKSIVALVGPGNNGGDALVALYHLSINKWKTCAYIVRNREQDDTLVARLLSHGGQVITVESDPHYGQLRNSLENCAVLLDGVFGTGIKLPLKAEIAFILNVVKQFLESKVNMIHVVAVDCPSGVDSETGEIADETIPSELTVTMAGIKTGLIKFPAAKMVGELRIANIGTIENLPAYTKNNKFTLTCEDVKKYLPNRPLDAHKGTFGSALIVAGSVNYTGAALLAGMAAYRSGAGLVTMAIPGLIHGALAGQFPESTWVLLPHETGVISVDAAKVIRKNLERATAILIGPGFGLQDTTLEFLNKLFSKAGSIKNNDIGFIHKDSIHEEKDISQKPIVMDADGLKLFSKIPDWYSLLPSLAILTPHPGEMSVMTGLSTDEIQENRLDVATKYAKQWGHIVVLKGAFTVIAAPDGQLAVVPIASAALARAGTGDVLAGLIVGLRAQGVDPFWAACAGAWIHATAGVVAAKHMGNTASVIASDVLNAIPEVITDVTSN